MSISQLVPIKEAETTLLDELHNEGGPVKTGILVKRSIKRFPAKLTPSELRRKTPSGTPWWPGRFRYDLNRLKKKGETYSPIKGHWEITGLGCLRLDSMVK